MGLCSEVSITEGLKHRVHHVGLRLHGRTVIATTDRMAPDGVRVCGADSLNSAATDIPELLAGAGCGLGV